MLVHVHIIYLNGRKNTLVIQFSKCFLCVNKYCYQEKTSFCVYFKNNVVVCVCVCVWSALSPARQSHKWRCLVYSTTNFTIKISINFSMNIKNNAECMEFTK